jgi:hypothetical protein
MDINIPRKQAQHPSPITSLSLLQKMFKKEFDTVFYFLELPIFPYHTIHKRDTDFGC